MDRWNVETLGLLCLGLGAAAAVLLWALAWLARSRTRALAALGLSQARYQQLLDTAHEGIWVLGPDAGTRYANPQLSRMFGCEAGALAVRGLHDYLGDNPPDVLARLRAGDSSGVHDLSYRRADGQTGWAIVSARPAPGGDGALLMLTDISARKAAELALAAVQIGLEVRIKLRTAELVDANAQLQRQVKVRESAEQALAASEQRLHAVISTLPLPLFIRDAASRVVMMNKAAEDQWGARFGQVEGTRGSAWCPPQQLARQLDNDRLVFARRELQVLEEEVWNAALGENRLVESFRMPVYDAAGEPLHLICMWVDVTDRKRVEEALRQSFAQLRQLTGHLETIQEEERKRIAVEIHDELGQNLLALKMDIEMLNARDGERHPQLRERVSHVLETLDATIRSVRSIINELHPSTLELGLPAALEWLLKEFEQRSGIPSHLVVRGADGTLPDTRLTSVIFRIIQEALVNIVRHAQADHVEAILAIEPQAVSITIIDNGVGMQPGDAGKAAAFGLRGIKERVDVFGGEMVIDSHEGGGTSLSILIPKQVQEEQLDQHG